jgi:HAD superfamily hydrolase (TIGR01509 family)
MRTQELEKLLASVDALIFDCDGTLVDSASVYNRAWANGFSSYGKEMAAEWYIPRAGLSEYVLMDAFERLHGKVLDRERTIARMREAFLTELAALREIAAIARRNIGIRPMAVASGGPAAVVKPSLEVTGLSSLFDAVVTFDEVGKAKPEPDLFLEASRRLKTAPDRCLVFEDSAQGFEAARRAGMKMIDVAELQNT